MGISLLDFGGIAQAKGLLGIPPKGPLDPRNLFQPFDPGQGPQGAAPPPMVEGPSPFATPFDPGPAPPQAPPQRRGLFDIQVPEEMQGLLTPDQQRQVKPDFLSALGTFIGTGKRPRQQMYDRANELLNLQKLVTERQQAEALRKAREEINARYPIMPEMSRADIHQTELRRFADLMRAGDATALAQGPQMLNAMEPQGVATPAKEQFRPVQKKDGTWTTINEATGLDPKGQPVEGMVPREPATPRPQRQLTTINVDGKNVTGWADADAGTFMPIGGAKTTVTQDRANTAYRKTLADMNTSERLLLNAMDMVDANPTAFGLKNLLPNVARERLPWRDNPLDAATKAAVEAVVGELRHDRFGGAISKQEAEMAIALFTKSNSPSDVVLAKLGELQKIVAAKKAGYSEAFGAAPATVPGETKEQMWNRLTRGGMDPDAATAAVRKAIP